MAKGSTPAGRGTSSRGRRSASPSTKRRAPSASRAPCRTRDEALQHVIAEKRGALRRSACLELIDADVSFEDVGGLEVVKGWVEERVVAFDAGAREFGLAEPRGMLVCGVQGCGKSLLSKATARVLGLPLVRLDFAEVFAAGSPEHAIHEATRAVEAVAPVVLWVDEIEKGLGADSGGRPTRARLRGVPDVAARASRRCVRRSDGQRGRPATARARPPRSLRRSVLRRPALPPRSERRSCRCTC